MTREFKVEEYVSCCHMSLIANVERRNSTYIDFCSVPAVPVRKIPTLYPRTLGPVWESLLHTTLYVTE